MNIIFGRDQAVKLSENYTVLELDTIQVGSDGPEITAFCVVESIPIIDMPKVDRMKDLHANMLVEYKKRNWNYCENALEHLIGFWNKDLDTFYENFKNRIDEYKENEPGDDWTGVIQQSAKDGN